MKGSTDILVEVSCTHQKSTKLDLQKQIFHRQETGSKSTKLFGWAICLHCFFHETCFQYNFSSFSASHHSSLALGFLVIAGFELHLCFCRTQPPTESHLAQNCQENNSSLVEVGHSQMC